MLLAIVQIFFFAPSIRPLIEPVVSRTKQTSMVFVGCVAGISAAWDTAGGRRLHPEFGGGRRLGLSAAFRPAVDLGILHRLLALSLRRRFRLGDGRVVRPFGGVEGETIVLQLFERPRQRRHAALLLVLD